METLSQSRGALGDTSDAMWHSGETPNSKRLLGKPEDPHGVWTLGEHTGTGSSMVANVPHSRVMVIRLEN